MDIGNFKNLAQLNILLGKNGCGKSRALQSFDSTNRSSYNIKYIPPERGGEVLYQSGMEEQVRDIENNATNNRKNQVLNYRQQSFARLHLEEVEILRAEAGLAKNTFNEVLVEVNSLLGSDLAIIQDKKNRYQIGSKDFRHLSSGEAEMVSLCVDIIAFLLTPFSDRDKILLLDEPDAHIHPDLQDRFLNFLRNVQLKFGDSKDAKFVTTIVIATHSTVFLNIANIQVCFMKKDDQDLKFIPFSETHNKIVPLAAPHPLSNIFNNDPLLLVEGEDDVRVWQWARRKSKNQIRIVPCETESKDKMSEFENVAEQILPAIFDSPVIFSLRDRDDDEELITDLSCVKRSRTSCRAVENLLLSDESLKEMESDWDTCKEKIENWINDEAIKPEGQRHKKYQYVFDFKEKGFERKTSDLKEIRNIIVYLLDCKNDWEIIVGKSIADNLNSAKSKINQNGSIFNFLGEKTVNNLLVK